MKNIDAGGGGITSVASVSRFNKAGDTFAVYTGRMGSPALIPFSLTAGEAYFVSMLTSRSNIPSHY